MNIFPESLIKDDIESFSESQKLSSVLLKCGNSGSAILLDGTSSVTVFPIITLNISHFCVLHIRLNFTCNIDSINWVGTLRFQLFRLCSDNLNSTTVGSQWLFTKTISLTDVSTFSFFVDDCDICPSEECKYAVVLIPDEGNVGNIIINNATLSAIVADNVNVLC